LEYLQRMSLKQREARKLKQQQQIEAPQVIDITLPKNNGDSG